MAGGFNEPVSIEPVEHRSRGSAAELPAIAYCLGTPLRNELERRDPTRLDEATKRATTRLRERFGLTDLDSKIRGFVITTTAP